MTPDSGELAAGASYRVLAELPGHAGPPAVHHFPDGKGTGSGVIVRFDPAVAAPWIGVFRSGDMSAKAHSGLHLHPAAGTLCVVVRGAAYVVHAERPERTRCLDHDPVMEVWPVPALGLLLLADPWQVVALDANGERWRTGRIALDGLKIDKEEGGVLHVLASGLEDDVPVAIDLVSGTPSRLLDAGAG